MVEEVLQTGAKEVNDQNVVEAFLTKVINIRDPGCFWSVLFLQYIDMYMCVYVCGP